MTSGKRSSSTDVDAKIEELREVIREANGTLKDLRAERKAAAAELLVNMEQIAAATRHRIDAQVEKGLAEYRVSLEKSIERSEQAVFARFDRIASLLAGEGYTGLVKKSGLPADELLRQYIRNQGGQISAKDNQRR